MSALADAIKDSKAAFNRLLQARDVDERRALRDVLENLYSLRCYREGDTKATKSAYRQRAAACRSGRMTEGVIFLRGEMIHKLTKRYSPEKPDPLSLKVDDSRYRAYESDVAGQPVLETLHTAIEFLENDLGPSEAINGARQ